MEDEMFKPFECPQDVRLVVFKSMVFKVKCCFRTAAVLTPNGEERRLRLSETFQQEIKRVLLVCLSLLSESRPPRPIHTDNIVVYPFLNYWQAQAILDFYKEGKRLLAFKKSLTLYIELLGTNDQKQVEDCALPKLGVASKLQCERSCAPTKRPCTPTKRPHAPTKRPHAPTKRPHAPTKRPCTPTKRPCTPTKRPCTPTKRPCTPTKRPCTPTKRPCTPTKRPCTPTKRPCTPTKRPCTPTKRPCTPTKRPCTPTKRPCTPTKRPCTPTKRPCTPTKRPCTLTKRMYDPICPCTGELNEMSSLPTEQAAMSHGSMVESQMFQTGNDDSGMYSSTEDMSDLMEYTTHRPWFFQTLWQKIKSFVGLK